MDGVPGILRGMGLSRRPVGLGDAEQLAEYLADAQAQKSSATRRPGEPSSSSVTWVNGTHSEAAVQTFSGSSSRW